jgi:hypothetical protein
MALDRKLAEATLIEILDALNGDRVVGTGFRLIDNILATSCQCLPRPTGAVQLPDADAPKLPVLVRVRRPNTPSAASAVVWVAETFSRLALLKDAKAADLEVPDELNPEISAEELIGQVEPALPSLAAQRQGPGHLYTGGGWVEGFLTDRKFSLRNRADRIPRVSAGAPVFDEDGRVVGVIAFADGSGPDAQLWIPGEDLPGSLLRAAAQASSACTGATAAHQQAFVRREADA